MQVRAGSSQCLGAPSERWRPRNPSLRFLFRPTGSSHPLAPRERPEGGRPERRGLAGAGEGERADTAPSPGPARTVRRAMERAYAASCRAASAPVGATAASSAATPAAPRRRTKGLKGGGGGEGSGGLGTSGSSSPSLRRGKASGRTKKGRTLTTVRDRVPQRRPAAGGGAPIRLPDRKHNTEG